MRSPLILSVLALAMTAQAAHAQTGEHQYMSDADYAHCYAIGLAEKANAQSDVEFMQRPDQQGKFSADDIQKMKDFIKGVDDDYLTWFDPDQSYSQAEVDEWAAKNHQDIDNELDRCFDLLDADMQALMDELSTMSDSSSSSSSSSH